MAKGKPSAEQLAQYLPDSAVEFAEAANQHGVTPQISKTEANPVNTDAPKVSEEIVAAGVSVEAAIESIDDKHHDVNIDEQLVHERRVQVSLKMDESLFWAIKDKATLLTKKTGKRVTFQNVLEQITIDYFK
jgi:hypothetical protein